MANEFTARNGLIAQKDSVITGSLIVTNGITGSLLGTASTASYVTGSIFTNGNRALSASYAISASFAPDTTFPYTGSATISGSLVITGSLTGSLVVNGLIIGKGKNTLDNIYINTNGSSITTGVQNYCIGTSAGTGITSGIYNVCIGHTAGVSINSGASNITIGRQAGGRITTGTGNLAIGETAMYYNNTGNYNSAYGTLAMLGTDGTANSNNTAIGAVCAYTIAAGSNNNVFVGYQAARYISGGVTAIALVSASVFLGMNTMPLASSQTNQIVIGYSATGLGSNTVVLGNNSIITTALKGNILIGTTTDAGYKLDVVGTSRLNGNSNITGSLNVTGGITGSLLGTASTASYVVTAQTASYVLNAVSASSVSGISNLISNNTDNYVLTAQGTGSVNGESLLQFDGQKLSLLYQSGDEGGELLLGKAATNTSLTGSGVTIDIWQNRLRFFEQGGTARGAYIDISAAAAGVGTNLLGGSGPTFPYTGSAIITGSLSVTGTTIAGFNPTPLTGSIRDGVTSVLGDLQDWDSQYYSGEVLYSELSGDAVNFGNICYREASGRWLKASGEAVGEASINMLGIALNDTTGPVEPLSILTRGYVETTYASVSATGEPLYMTTSPVLVGRVTYVAPSTAGNIVRLIGNTFWDSSLQTNTKNIIYFNPDNTWIEL
jgi:hypothetical protein